MAHAHRKGRRFEQQIGKLLLEHDGACPMFEEMTTSTGRIGQQTNLQIDVISKNIACECKSRKSLPKWLMEPWEQIIERAEKVKKTPLLVLKENRSDPLFVVTEETLIELLETLNE